MESLQTVTHALSHGFPLLRHRLGQSLPCKRPENEAEGYLASRAWALSHQVYNCTSRFTKPAAGQGQAASYKPRHGSASAGWQRRRPRRPTTWVKAGRGRPRPRNRRRRCGRLRRCSCTRTSRTWCSWCWAWWAPWATACPRPWCSLSPAASSTTSAADRASSRSSAPRSTR